MRLRNEYGFMHLVHANLILITLVVAALYIFWIGNVIVRLLLVTITTSFKRGCRVQIVDCEPVELDVALRGYEGMSGTILSIDKNNFLNVDIDGETINITPFNAKKVTRPGLPGTAREKQTTRST